MKTPLRPRLSTTRSGRVSPVPRIRIPIVPIGANPARLGEGVALPLGPDLIGVGLALQELQAEPLGDVKGDVAVQEPGAGIVGLEGDDHVAGPGHQDHVAAGRVVVFEGEVARVEVFFVGLFEDGEVVAVEVDLEGWISRSAGLRGAKGVERVGMLTG